GRFFDSGDELQRVAALGAGTADALFPDGNAVGNEIRVRGVPFDVIGVLEAKGSSPDGADEDNQIVIPLRTAMRRVYNTTWLTTIFVTATDLNAARDDIETLLRARHRRNDFSVQ